MPSRLRQVIAALAAYKVVAQCTTRRGVNGITQWRVRECATKTIVFRSWYYPQACAERDRLIAHAVLDAIDAAHTIA